MDESRLERTPSEVTLKQGSRRSVRTAHDRVVKRWHAPGLAGFLDGRRAGHEHALAQRLAALGLPVPRPLELRRTDGGGCELVSERIEGAVPLADVLAGTVPWPAPVAASLARFGAELARLHAAGLEHGDLHAGNVLLDLHGAAWIVDLSRARLHRDPGSSAARAARERDLVQLAAETREVLSEGLRTRFLVAWSRAAAERGLGRVDLAALASRVERGARLRRRAGVGEHLDRFTRTSPAAGTIAFDRDRVRGIVRADHDVERALATIRAIGAGPVGGADGSADGAYPLEPGAPFGAALVVRRADGLDPRRAWLAAARLEVHRLPAPRPWCLVEAPHALALFGLPAGAVRCDASGAAGEHARELGALAGALADRGLALAADASHDLWIDGGGELLLGVGRRVVDARTGVPAGPFAAAWSALDERGRAAWTEAWIAARRGGADERRRLAAEHGLG